MDNDALDEIETAKSLLRKKLSAGPYAGCTSYIQRQMQCGYNLAASIMEILEKQKFITKPDRVGARSLINP